MASSKHNTRRALLGPLIALLSSRAIAQNCISLQGSTTCSAFNASSFSTNNALVGLYPFLAGVTSAEDFDRELTQYVSSGYVNTKYNYLFGCNGIDLTNTTNYYARYTLSFICNGVVQNSREPCGLSGDDTMPLCADACAELTLSEEAIVGSDQLCPGRSNSYQDQLRSDFTNCALPANSLAGSCITGESNEPDDCGFGSNLLGLCNFCRASTENGTDSCCLTANATGRCEDVVLPVFSSLTNLIPTATASDGSIITPTGTSASDNDGNGGGGLSGGAIAGIVVGAVVGFFLLLGLIIFCCLRMRRRRRDSTQGSLLNQPSPQRKGQTPMAYNPPPSQQGYEVLPGGRVARMTALQGEDQPRAFSSDAEKYAAGAAVGTALPAVAAAGMKKGDQSPVSGSPNGSSSNDYSSPDGVASGQSEQLPFFKDYYSNDDIHPGDNVAVLWAYQPRAGDEFELERGDMLKVVGIWDDGWATGVRLDDRAEDYDGKNKQRDSGVSNGSVGHSNSPTPTGEVKAFPLVCVCLPEAWKKTVEGDTGEGGPGFGPPP